MHMRTELWEITRDGKHYLMNTITAGSRFRSLTVPENMHTAEAQLKVAQELKDGWVTNGAYGRISTYEIRQFDRNGVLTNV